MQQFPIYLTISLCFSIPILGLVLAKGFLETDARLTYIGNYTNCLTMFICQFSELCLITTIHFWLSFLFRKIRKAPLIVLDGFFISTYIHITFLELSEFNAGLSGMQFTTPSAFQIWVFRIGKIINHFTDPVFAIPTNLTNNAVNLQIVLEVLKTKFNFYFFLFAVYVAVACIMILFLYKYRKYILSSTLVGIYLFPHRKEVSKEEINEGPVSIKTCSDDKEGNEPQYEKPHKDSENNIQQKEDSKETKPVLVPANNTKNNISKPILITLHLLSVLYLIVLLYVIYNSNDFKTSYFSSISFMQTQILSLTHFDGKISQKVSDNLVTYLREYLPPNRKWLDTRPYPEYPAIHSDMKTFCAYNNDSPDCADYTPSPQVPLVKELPNVLFIVYESFTPSGYLIDNDFISEHASRDVADPIRYVTSTKYFSKTIMSSFNHFQDYATVFSGMSSLGIPTASGLHALMSGMSPSQSYYNVLDGSFKQTDDFPSQMRNYGYRSFWIASAGLNFDSLNLWMYRRSAREEALNRMKCKEAFGDLIDDELLRNLVGEKKIEELKDCDEDKVEKKAKKIKEQGLDFPKWFDYIWNYPLTKDNAKYLELDPDSALKKTKWASDRVSTRQVITHWKQQKEFMKKNNITKPIFAGMITMESHFEFFGYDKDEFYEHKITKEMKKHKSEWTKNRFIRVNKYADKYIGQLLQWVKDNEPNTIFAITGDHSVWKVPQYDQEEIIVDDVVYSADCVHHSSGIDSFFVTSGMIGYFGDDPKVKEVMHFNTVKGKTMKLPSDHNDLIYTIEDILTKLNGTSVQPTTRRSRNLLDLTDSLVQHIKNGSLDEALEEIDSSHWKGFSYNHYSFDYKEGTNLYRTHPADLKGNHVYKRASYPQCFRRKDAEMDKVGRKEGYSAFERMGERYLAENYINYHNRLYNYAFRDTECVERGHCEFPKHSEEQHFYDLDLPGRFLVSVTKIAVLFWVILEGVSILFLLIQKWRKKQYWVL